MAENVGTIEYTVKADTAALLTAGRSVGSINRDMQKSFDQTDAAVSTLTNSFRQLSSVASSVVAALSANEVIKYADAWTELNNKLVNSVSANEQLIDVTNRVFDVSQQTRTSVEATATLYGRLEKATRKYNLSAQQLSQLTTTINQGLVVSGATTEEAASATVQLSQALAAGALRGEEFNAITESGSRLAQALADSLGADVGQLRTMAAAGQLTTDVVVDGLLKQGVQIGDEFAKTTQTIGQAFTIATNNITKFVGESSTVQSTVAGISAAVVTVSENLDELSSVFVALAAVMGSRFVGALSASTIGMVKQAIASKALAQAESVASQAAANQAAATLRAAEAAKVRAIDEIRLAEMMKISAFNAGNLSLSEQKLSAARMAAAGAVGNYNAALAANVEAQNAAAAAAGRASTATGILRGAMSLIGGPAGAAMLAASAIFYFYQKSQEAREEAVKLADSVNGLTSRMQEMSNVEIAANIGKLRGAIPELTSAVNDAQKEFDEATYHIRDLQKEVDNWGTGTKRGRQAAEALTGAMDEQAEAAFNLDNAQKQLSQTQSAIGLLQAQMNGQLEQGIDLLRRDGEAAGVAEGMIKKFGDAINFATRAKEKFNSSSLKVDRSEKGDQILKQLEDENALLSITDKRERAVAAARRKALDAGVADNSNQLRQIEEQAGLLYDKQKAEKGASAAAKSGESERAKAAKKASQELEKQQQELERSAKSGASLVPEVAENTAYQENQKNLQNALNAGLISHDQYNAQSEKMAQEHQQKLNKINATPVVSAQQKMAGEVDPVQQLANENAQKLALIQQYEMAGALSHGQAIALKNAQDTQYEQQRLAAIEQQYRAQSELNDFTMSMIDAVGQRTTNAITGLITGTQSAEEAVRGLASTILNQAVGALVQMGIQAVKNMVIGQTAAASSTAMAAATGTTMASAYAPAAAMASLASFGANAAPAQAGITSTVALASGMALAGGRRYGGTTSSGSMYRVNESGEPEMFQSSGGKQYMMPTTSGKVVPASDVGGGGASTPVNVVINNMASGTTVENQGYNPDTKTITLAVKEVARQLRTRTGDVSRALGDNWNTTGKSQ